MRVSVKENLGEAIAYRCFLNGRDISKDTYAADDIEGWADCYIRGEDGIILRGSPKERRYGLIKLVLKDAPSYIP